MREIVKSLTTDPRWKNYYPPCTKPFTSLQKGKGLYCSFPEYQKLVIFFVVDEELCTLVHDWNLNLKEYCPLKEATEVETIDCSIKGGGGTLKAG